MAESKADKGTLEQKQQVTNYLLYTCELWPLQIKVRILAMICI